LLLEYRGEAEAQDQGNARGSECRGTRHRRCASTCRSCRWS
jgi:hypothetical protein